MNTKLTLGMLALFTFTGSVYAADISICPKVSEITVTAFKDTDPAVEAQPGDTAAGFTEAFRYTATSGGKTWTGQVHGSNDTYLESKYELKVEDFDELNGKLVCDYGGKRLVENDEINEAHLRLLAPK